MKKYKIIFILVLIFTLSLLSACSNSSSKNDLINNPSIENVKEAITNIESITLIEIVTEDNDPNEQLGKQGGYVGCLYFKSSLVTDETDESAIKAGTDGGGSIEVYKNKSEAKKRNEYLAQMDGTIFSSGSHKVLGTLVIRTSNKLKASQQTKLETDIVNALITDGDKVMPSKVSEIDESAPVTLQLDKEETKERISYRIASSWDKVGNTDEDFWMYLPYEVEEDGFFSVQINSLDTSFPIVDKESLNVNLDSIIEQVKTKSILYDFNLLERTDINGIPFVRYEGKFDDSGDIYSTNIFSFLYGNFTYRVSAVFPQTADSQFFISTLTQIMDSLVIEEYTQSELPPSNEGDIGDYYVKILDATLVMDYEDIPAIIVDFEFTNNAENAEAFLFSTNVKAYQDGVELDTAIIMDQSLYDAGLAQKHLKNGVSLVVQSAFALTSDSPVEIEVTKLIAFEKDMVITRTFSLK